MPPPTWIRCNATPQSSFFRYFVPTIPGSTAGQGRATGRRLELVEAEHARAARPHEHQPRIDDPGGADGATWLKPLYAPSSTSEEKPG